jgi:hypothetical protein
MREIDRFMEKINKEAPDGCWEWEAATRGELQREIAARFGVQRTLISRIKTGARRRAGV